VQFSQTASIRNSVPTNQPKKRDGRARGLQRGGSGAARISRLRESRHSERGAKDFGIAFGRRCGPQESDVKWERKLKEHRIAHGDFEFLSFGKEALWQTARESAGLQNVVPETN